MELPELTWGAASDRGLRQENQDSFLVAPPVFAVADGMGGHVGGAQASGQAVVRLREIAEGPAVSVEAIRTALERADKDILAMGEHIDPLSRPGTTIAGMALVDVHDQARWAVFHVGDSRIYRCANDGLRRISTDHSVVQALVDAGAITEERAETHPQRHMITKALGFGDRGQPDVALLPVEPGQRFLMCSDGLTGEISDQRIAEVLASAADDQAVADQLVAEATQHGAQDNVTVIVLHVGGDDGAAAGGSIGQVTTPFDTVPLHDAPPEG
jgi:serine/threonine protein phosphatase PrpC